MRVPAIRLCSHTATPCCPCTLSPEYTTAWSLSVVKCPCPSHLTSDKPHTSTLTLSNSLPNNYVLPNCSILRTFHVPNRSLFRSWSVPPNVVLPVADFTTLPWLLNRGRGPCLSGRRPGRHAFCCVVLSMMLFGEIRW